MRESARRRLNRELYKKVFLIRRAEEAIRRHYAENEMKTPMHMAIGEEAIAAGICHALGEEGEILSTYRSHGAYLAKTGETDKFFAELYGKKTGVAKGKAGSMHLSSPEHGHLGSSAVVGTTISVAVGAAFANLWYKNKKFVAVFFGDGAVDEGVFWESINLASLWKLPVLFVCEDNDLAIHVPVSLRHGYRSLPKIVSQFDCNVYATDTTDPEKIYGLAKDAMMQWKKTRRPALLYCRYFRYLEHVGIGEDFDAGYRSRKEFEAWLRRDPVLLQRKKLLRLGVAEKELEKIEKTTESRIKKSIFKAQKAPFPEKGELYKDIFYGE